MTEQSDTNAAIWKSKQVVQDWTAQSRTRERSRGEYWTLMGELLPFRAADGFTFLDLGAGTGSAARTLLELYPKSSAVLADFSQQMMQAAEPEMRPYEGRYRYVEFDMTSDVWPAEIPSELDAVITSLCVHHLPDDRKQGLFAEILEHLRPGGWYVNYDPVTSLDPVVAAAWQGVGDRRDPDAAHKRDHLTPAEQVRHENHVRYMIPLEQQLAYLRSAGFEGVDVYWKHLENAVYGGRRPT